MPTVLAAVLINEFLSALGLSKQSKLYAMLCELLNSIGVEFHRDLLELLQQFSAEDLERFVHLWIKVPSELRTAFAAFIVTGEDPNGRFLAFLDENRDCQEAVDLAFSAHMKSLHDFGQALAQAEAAVCSMSESPSSAAKKSDLAILLRETERAEAALESVEKRAAKLSLKPVFEGVHGALQLVEGASASLRALL
jgi:hypothetical protein